MHKLTIPFLIAASDMIDKIKDVIPKLADHLNAPVQELYYLWMARHFEKERMGIIEDTNWKYWFHVKSCLLEHRKDKRFLPVKFGPKGRIDTLGSIDNFLESGVFNYVMTSKSPWPEYKELKDFFWGHYSQDKYEQTIKHIDNYYPSNEPSPIFVPSGADSKRQDLHHELISHGFVEPVDPKLFKLNSGKFIAKIKLNKFLKSCTENDLFDFWVRDRWVLSAKGKDQIKNYRR
jgi:hypothetical protein